MHSPLGNVKGAKQDSLTRRLRALLADVTEMNGSYCHDAKPGAKCRRWDTIENYLHWAVKEAERQRLSDSNA